MASVTVMEEIGAVRQRTVFHSDSILHYTSHHNWSWVLDGAIRQLCSDQGKLNITSRICARYRDLPSQCSINNSGKRSRIKYALFRVEMTGNVDSKGEDISLEGSGSAVYRSVWATSLAFAFLDPKDALYRHLKSQNANHLMPKTILLDWDVNNINDIDNLPSSPALLKAALGSGGFGLYFVNNKQDVLSIIRKHADRARSYPGFLDSLRSDYGGNVPSWSLQALINSYRSNGISNDSRNIKASIKTEKASNVPSSSNSNVIEVEAEVSVVNDNISANKMVLESTNNPNPILSNCKRCQIRVYAVCKGNHLYMYKTFEARLPSWDIDLDVVLKNPTSGFQIIPSDTVSTLESDDVRAPELIDEDKIDEKNNEDDEKYDENYEDEGEKERKVLTVEEFEEYCCKSSGARPYNKDRNKSVTDRFIVDELNELLCAKDIIGTTVRDAMKALKIPILEHLENSIGGAISSDQIESTNKSENNGTNNSKNGSTNDSKNESKNESESCSSSSDKSSNTHQEMAIAGIDLMLEISSENNEKNTTQERTPVLTASILEINNNPAMAGESKTMSVKYKEHLITFAKNILLLGLDNEECNSEHYNFELLW